MAGQNDTTLDRREVLKTSAAMVGEHWWEGMLRLKQSRNSGM